MKVTLELMSGAQDGEEFKARKSVSIGRERSNDVALQLDKYISRQHAKLHIEGDEVYLEDLDSTNGTFYDGERIRGKIELENGDYFRIGRTWVNIYW